MECLAIRESVVTCPMEEGPAISGTLLELSRHAAVFESIAPVQPLRAGAVLPEVQIRLRGGVVYQGRATVRNFLAAGLTEVCEISLGDGWRSGDLSLIREAGAITEQFNEFLNEWGGQQRIRSEFKILVADMQSMLTQLRLWLGQVELALTVGMESGAGAEGAREDAARKLGPAVSAAIDSLWSRFEPIALSLQPSEQAVHRAYLRRALHPLLMCSPFARRAFEKPLGYAGDFELVNMIARDPFEGASLYAMLINHWLLQQAPSAGHRNRLQRLEDVLVQESARCLARGRGMRALNLACGPAIEVQRFVSRHRASEQTSFCLLDFNDETIEHTRRALGQIRKLHGRATSFDFVRRSVQHLLREAGALGRNGTAQDQFDLVYCAGLFDYLTDPVCQRLMKVMCQRLAPGGLLLVTNVDPGRSVGLSLDYMLDWPLIARSAAQLRRMAASAGLTDGVTVNAEATGVNLFLEFRRLDDF